MASSAGAATSCESCSETMCEAAGQIKWCGKQAMMNRSCRTYSASGAERITRRRNPHTRSHHSVSARATSSSTRRRHATGRGACSSPRVMSRSAAYAAASAYRRRAAGRGGLDRASSGHGGIVGEFTRKMCRAGRADKFDLTESPPRRLPKPDERRVRGAHTRELRQLAARSLGPAPIAHASGAPGDADARPR